MKKVLLFILASVTVSYTQAQQFYFRAGLGGAFPQAGQTIDGYGNLYNGSTRNTNGNISYSIKKASFGSGFQGSIAGGYMINNHIGIDLDIAIGLANTKYKNNNYNDTIGGVACNETVTENAQTPVFVIPSVVLQTGGKIVNIYSRFGLVVPLSSKVHIDDEIVNLPGTGAILDEHDIYTMKTYFSLGFSGVLGISYKLGENVSLWGELNLISLSAYAKEEDVTGLTVNGVSYFSQIPPSQRTYQYSFSPTVSNSSNTYYTYALPFSSIGINAGIRFDLPEQHRRAIDDRQEDTPRRRTRYYR